MNIFVSTATSKENIKKNLESNKLTQLMRSLVFDTNSINININLTSNEQTKYYETVNDDLNRNLYVDLCEPRRRKNVDLDVSCVKADRDYGQYLEHQDEKIEIFNKNDNDEKNNDNFQIEEKVNLENEKINLKTIKN